MPATDTNREALEKAQFGDVRGIPWCFLFETGLKPALEDLGHFAHPRMDREIHLNPFACYLVDDLLVACYFSFWPARAYFTNSGY